MLKDFDKKFVELLYSGLNIVYTGAIGNIRNLRIVNSRFI